MTVFKIPTVYEINSNDELLLLVVEGSERWATVVRMMDWRRGRFLYNSIEFEKGVYEYSEGLAWHHEFGIIVHCVINLCNGTLELWCK